MAVLTNKLNTDFILQCSDILEHNQVVNLAGDQEVLHHLSREKIVSYLWEDCFTDDDLFKLHECFKDFCNTWYKDGASTDISVYEDLSFGHTTALMLYYDLESWIKMFCLFEEVAKRNIECCLYVSQKNYFPDEFYAFIEELNKCYASNIKVEIVSLTYSGVNPSPSQVVGCDRAVHSFTVQNKFTKLSKPLWQFLNFVHSNKKSCRCFVMQLRDQAEYLDVFRGNVAHNMTLFFDSYANSPNILRRIVSSDIRVLVDDVDACAIDQDSADLFIKKVLEHCTNIKRVRDILDVVGWNHFKPIFDSYVERCFRNQINSYYYLKWQFEKYDINVSLCGGQEIPESFIVRHLMKDRGGRSYHLPHGFDPKEKHNYYLADVADQIFCYGEEDKERWEKSYAVDQKRLISIGFDKGELLEKSWDEKYRLNDPLDSKVLVLGDLFHNSVNSRINCFHYTQELCYLLKEMGFKDVVVRPHPAFFKYLKHTNEEVEYTLHGARLDDSRGKKFKHVVQDYHLVIGQHSTSIMDAIFYGTAYMTLIRNIHYGNWRFWLEDLYPKAVNSLEEVKNLIETYLESPLEFYNKQRLSIDQLGLYKQPRVSLWKQLQQESKERL